MEAPASIRVVTEGEVRWPFDLSIYDRSERITATEQKALKEYYEEKEKDRAVQVKRLKKPLRRLFRPIYDLLEHLNVRVLADSHAHIVRVLCKEMFRSRLTFWAWTQSQWATVIQPDTTSYLKHNGLPRANSRGGLIAFAYVAGNFSGLDSIGDFHREKLANRVFGREIVTSTLEKLTSRARSWGNSVDGPGREFPNLIYVALLENRSPFIEDLTLDVLNKLRNSNTRAALKRKIYLLSLVLKDFGVINEDTKRCGYRKVEMRGKIGVPADWAQWCDRWFNTSTYQIRSRKFNLSVLYKVGRWLGREYPECTSPDKWDQEMAATFVAAVTRLNIGDWAVSTKRIAKKKIGTPLKPKSKGGYLHAVRTFLGDCQEWGWIPLRLNVRRSLGLPRSLKALIGPAPRTIQDDLWAKLLWAGLNLSTEDLPQAGRNWAPTYPLEMVRAMAMVWLFSGLRSDEVYRLRLSCISWQREDVKILETDSTLSKDAVCWLEVPVNKTGKSFTKPVDRYVGEAVEAWEAVRPVQPARLDAKTNELVFFLFSYRSHVIGKEYINHSLIPILCKKAGIPAADARGTITSHRARSTIASQLFNSKEPMSLWDLKEWLGHRWLSSTEHYVRTSPTRLAKAYSDAGYFSRNVRTIEVLIDKDAITSGAAAAGKPWSFYDLGSGYCTNDFFVSCPHRMACAKCPFYLPKNSSRAQFVEGKGNLLRMRQEIPLTDEEIAAVDEGVESFEKLCERLADVPTPAGPTPRQLKDVMASQSGEDNS